MSAKIVRACVAVGGVPLVFADGEYARRRVEFDLRVPGRYIMTIGEAPRCAVFDVVVDEQLRVTCTLTALGRLRIVAVERVPVPDEQFRRQ